MAIDDEEADKTSQGRAGRAPDTEDGLYPGIDGDPGRTGGGGTQPLPGSCEPLQPVSETALAKPARQGRDKESGHKVDPAQYPNSLPPSHYEDEEK